MPGITFNSHDEYIDAFPEPVAGILQKMRKAIKQAAPKAEEMISYNMPAVKQHSVLVWYAAAKAHIGFYPKPEAIMAFKDKLKNYKTSKGAIQFPLDKPMPLSLIKEIVKYRLAEDAEQAKAKKKK